MWHDETQIETDHYLSEQYRVSAFAVSGRLRRVAGASGSGRYKAANVRMNQHASLSWQE